VPAWTPTSAYLDRSRLRAFAAKHGCQDYESLLRWSTEDLEGFWTATERDLRIAWRTPYTRVLDTSRGIPWTTWWTGGRMNYVETVLRHDGDHVAIVAEGEEGTVRRLTYRELAAQVASVAAGLRSIGV
jgi:acetyl-CoA synthetase